MDKRSKILIVIFAIVVTASTVATFNRYIVLKDISFNTDEESFIQSLIEDGLAEEDEFDENESLQIEEELTEDENHIEPAESDADLISEEQ